MTRTVEPATKASPRARTAGRASRGLGFVLGAAGGAATIFLLILAVARVARPRAQGDSVTGSLPEPAPRPSSVARPVVPSGEEARVRAALIADPADVDAHLDLARIHLARRDMQSASRETAYALARSPGHSRALCYEALGHLAVGETDLARDLLVKVIRSAPDMLEAYRYLALVDIRSGRDGDAEATLAEAARRHPDRADDLARFARETRQSRGRPQVRVTVDVAPRVRAPAVPGGVLFVIVRQAGQEKLPPVAVKRIASATFPLTTALYDSDSTAGAALPDHMLIDARLDGDGDPLTRSRSDPSARIDGVKRGDAPIRLVLTR